MLVGVISDTHDNLPLIDKVVQKLNKDKVELVLHAGDYVSPFVPPRFKSLKAKLIGVYGNNCAERYMLRKRFEDIGAELKSFFAEININGLKIALLHGHEKELLNSIIKSGAYNVVIHGHTHKAGVRTVNKTLIINPGEVCGYLSGEYTYALFDVDKFDVKIIQLDH